jgi:hypothetical protein
MEKHRNKHNDAATPTVTQARTPNAETKISRRTALRRLLVGAAGVTGASLLLSACRGRGTSDEQLADAQNTAADLTARPIACIGCRYCMPCPYGVDIPANLQLYNDAVSLDELPDPRRASAPDYPHLRRKFLAHYANTLPHLQRADHCIGCGRCLSSCPQRLDIPELMHRIESLVSGLEQRRQK